MRNKEQRDIRKTVQCRVSTSRPGPFNPTTRDNGTAKIIEEARRFVHELDKIDGCPQSSFEIDVCLRTIITAMHTAIVTRNWQTAAEAMVMTQQLEQSLREQ